jgi:predicted patatin/cPLA2 family phospholipase
MMSFGHVLDVMQQRRLSKSRYGQRQDAHKLWLVVESGGQAGAILGGFVSALESMGYLDCFDGIVGSSAGAMTGAYFATEAAALGTTIYPENNCDGRFINPLRLFSGRRPVMDLNYLVDDVMFGVKPLPLEKLRKSDIPVWAMCARKTGERELKPLHGVAGEDVRNAMKASASVPLWASTDYHTQDVWDGGLTEPVPIPSALAEGATHVLHLSRMCRISPAIDRDSWLDKLVHHPLLYVVAPDLWKLYRKRSRVWKSEFEAGLQGLQGYYMMALDSPKLDIATQNRRIIWSEIKRAYRHAGQVLGNPALQWPPEWSATP